MIKLRAELSKDYDIIIGEGLLDNCVDYIKNVATGTRLFIVTDSNVAPLYLKKVTDSLQKEYSVFSYTFTAGEQSKRFETINEIVCSMAQQHITRDDCVVALGGGVAGDMAGFAAAIYMRGIQYIQLPTTLLSAVDSSVGGKTGCDLSAGKNLIGAFLQPSLVLIDPSALNTLPSRYLNDGMAEVIKYGVIGSRTLFDTIISENTTGVTVQMIYECIKMKLRIVKADEFENGERKLLNFGHTLGHAIEQYYNYNRYTHGEAVGIGMYITSLCAYHNQLCDENTAKSIKTALTKYSLPYDCDADTVKLCSIALGDKKRQGNMISLVIADKIGSAGIHPVSADKLSDFFAR